MLEKSRVLLETYQFGEHEKQEFEDLCARVYADKEKTKAVEFSRSECRVVDLWPDPASLRVIVKYRGTRSGGG